MARDPRALARLFPDRDPHGGFRAGVAPAIWIVGLLLAAAGSAGLALAALVAANTEDATTVQLRAWGVLGADERWIAVHTDSPDGDSGCVLVRNGLVRWEDRAPIARVTLDPTRLAVERRRDGLWLLGETPVHCPSHPGSDLRAFEMLVDGQVEPPKQAWHPGPDPRVAHLFD